MNYLSNEYVLNSQPKNVYLYQIANYKLQLNFIIFYYRHLSQDHFSSKKYYHENMYTNLCLLFDVSSSHNNNKHKTIKAEEETKFLPWDNTLDFALKLSSTLFFVWFRKTF